VVATTLSRYCAYLVAFHPELLPGNPEKTELVFEAVKGELKATLGCSEYYCSWRRARVDKTMEAGLDVGRWTEKMVKNGATLAKALVDRAAEETLQAGSNRESRAAVWEALADVWTELVIYVAPSRTRSASRGTRMCWCMEASSSPCFGRWPHISAYPGRTATAQQRRSSSRVFHRFEVSIVSISAWCLLTVLFFTLAWCVCIYDTFLLIMHSAGGKVLGIGLLYSLSLSIVIWYPGTK
jgi:hypothetical protein